MSGEDVKQRTAEREAATAALREQLARLNLDGPFEFPQGDMFSTISILGGSRVRRFAICLRCGAMVLLDDAEELTEGRYTERGVRLHTSWHDDHDDPAEPHACVADTAEQEEA